MPLEVEATYENGVLRPDQPLPLSERERVTVRIQPQASGIRRAKVWSRFTALPRPWSTCSGENQTVGETMTFADIAPGIAVLLNANRKEEAMKTRGYACVLLLLAFAAPISALDLSTIDRKIVKEPVYASPPKYCLLVLGPEAKTRVWLVQDGDTLYVDRNGNGDLTEAGEKVAARKGDDMNDWLEFSAGEIREGNLLHRRLLVNVMKLDRRRRVR